MDSATFDTLTAAHTLEAAGIERGHAEAIAHAIRNGQGDLATKVDITAVKADITAVKADITVMKGEIAAVKADITVMKGEIAAVKADVTVMKGEIAAARGDIAAVASRVNSLQWVVGIQSAITLTTFAIVAAKLL